MSDWRIVGALIIGTMLGLTLLSLLASVTARRKKEPDEKKHNSN